MQLRRYSVVVLLGVAALLQAAHRSSAPLFSRSSLSRKMDLSLISQLHFSRSMFPPQLRATKKPLRWS